MLQSPNATDTDFDGLADGQELFVKSVKTPKRYPTRDQLWVFSDKIDLALGAPGWAIQGASAMVGFTHGNMGEIAAWLERWTGTADDLGVLLRQYGNAGQRNNFTSYDLLQKPSLGGSQLARDDLVIPGRTWYVKAYDSTVNTNGTIEYLQMQVAVRTLPNRADTDADGLNDSEELNLLADGFATDPWKVDSDGDGLADDEYFVRGTSPVRRDTDLDGHADGVDLYPLQDAFVFVKPLSAAFPVLESASEDGPGGDAYLEPFAVFRVGGEALYSAADLNALDTASWSPPYRGQFYVNVPDDVDALTMTVELWDWDYDVSNPDPIDLQTASGVQNAGTFTFSLASGSRTFSFFGSNLGHAGPYARPFDVYVERVAPMRAPVWILAPTDYAGFYNVTDAAGSIVGRRYVGEPRFVAFAIDEKTGQHSTAQALYLVPRSLFHDTQFADLLEAKALPAGLASALRFAQNGTTSANSDDLQMAFAGHLGSTDRNTLVDLLSRNVTGNLTYQWLGFQDDVVLLGLPDDALRLAAYLPFPHTTSVNYTWDISSGTRNGWSVWDEIWAGVAAVLDEVLVWIESGIVFVATVVDAFVDAVVAFGSWVWNGIVGASEAAAQAVASAVQAAAEAMGQVIDALANAILAMIHAALDPLINLVVAAYNAWAEGVAQLILSMRSLSVDDFVRGLIQFTFYSAFALAIFAIIVAFSVAEKITNAMTLGMANLAGFVIGAVAGLIIGMLTVAAINEWLGSTVIEDLLPPGFDDVTGATFTVAQFLFAYELAQRPLKPIRGIESGLHDAIIGLMLLGVGSAIELMAGDSLFGLIALVIVDVVALHKELSGLVDVITISGRGANLVRMWYPFLYPVTISMNAIGIATAAAELAGDTGRLVNRLGAG